MSERDTRIPDEPQRPTLSQTPKPPKVDRSALPVRQAPLPRRDKPLALNPKRVRGGVKLGSKEGPSGHWIAQRWIRLVEEGGSGDALVEGLDYAKMGQSKSLSVGPGTIEASVQGRGMKPYAVRIGLASFESGVWDRVIAAMVEQAIYAAKLMAGEVPEHIEDLFHPLGLHLFPRGAGELKPTCTCGHPTPWCKHVACAMYLVADGMASNPFLIFNLRGMATEALLERLRQRRTSTGSVHGAPPVYTAHVPGATDLEAQPLDAVMDRFWEAGPGLSELDLSIDRPVVSKALLRRLGPSPFVGGRFPLVGLLATCYDLVGERALRGEGEEVPGGPEDGPAGAPGHHPEPAAEMPQPPAAHERLAKKVKAKAVRAKPAGDPEA